MKLLEFRLATKENTTDYTTVEKYLAKRDKSVIVPVSEIIEKDFLAELRIEYETDTCGIGNIDIASYDVQTLMQWVKENNPELYELIPPFRIDQFEEIAKLCKAGSYLDYNVIDETSDRGTVLDCETEPDDFVPERCSVEESLEMIKANGSYCTIQCYPHTPIGFWVYYGIDFQSLLDHVVED
ncbi:hypothetical protein PQD71_gp167 [Kosakonia phage Kc263]|uniref:Uncharacterized protein n=1 Tax=Kosakonia phage Kc263 TaxID=2863194 RepID=A0AAE8BEH5_9CAUD|nr:hypothetical protein PQD71_gp167 [Kosakonia phage Kc263]QYN80060.1 hypothetical protein [Kosakonia phage Kc263]